MINVFMMLSYNEWFLIDGINNAYLYSNTVIVGLDSTNLNYDRMTANGDAVLTQRIAESLPSKPKVHVVNVY